MAIEYTNRKEKTYYLHQGTTKTGKPRYYFSLKSEGVLVEAIPEGFEIYETPNARVFLRRIPPKLITEAEVALVKQAMHRLPELRHYLMAVKERHITIHEPAQDVALFVDCLRHQYAISEEDLERTVVSQVLTYSPVLRFTLIDKDTREFRGERYCYRGSIDDWIWIGVPDTLENLTQHYLQHLGKDSYYGLL